MRASQPVTPERWLRIEEIFHAALARPEEERSAFLASAAGDDAELLAEVGSLLREADGDDPPIAGAVAAGLALAAEEEPAPERIGPYRVLGVIGRGGRRAPGESNDAVLTRRRRGIDEFRQTNFAGRVESGRSWD